MAAMAANLRLVGVGRSADAERGGWAAGGWRLSLGSGGPVVACPPPLGSGSGHGSGLSDPQGNDIDDIDDI